MAIYTPGQLYDQKDIEGFNQYDPGIFKSNGENYFVPQVGKYLYAADNPGAFGLGGKAATSPFIGGQSYGDDAKVIRDDPKPATPAPVTTPISTPKATNPSAGNFSPIASPYTFAGFDPGAHSGEAMTATEPKYAVYNELAKLSTQPGFDRKNFASTAATDLNSLFGTDEFKALDGETLGYGDEYVHGADNGYGLGRGSYNPDAPGEFFWGSNGPSGSPTPPPSPSPAPAPAPSPSPAPRLNPTFNPTDYGNTFAGPAGGGVFPDPVQQVGQDPLSLLNSGALASLILGGGRLTSDTGDQAYAALSKYINGGDLNNRLESIREKMGLLQRAQLNDARGALADRGLLSEGSTAQGPEMSTIGRISSNLAQTYSAAARDAVIADDSNMLGAIQMATGLDESAANRLLQTTTNITSRQEMLSKLALQSLEDNMSWNKFLAQYGLDRDKTMYMIQNDQIGALAPLIQAFVQLTNTSVGGFV